MGQNLYGYDWTLPFVQGTTAKAVSPQQAIQLAAANNVAIEYDEKHKLLFSLYRIMKEKNMKSGLKMHDRFKQNLIS